MEYQNSQYYDLLDREQQDKAALSIWLRLLKTEDHHLLKQFQEPEKWDYTTAFQFETPCLQQIFQEVDPGNTAMTQSMHEFDPPEKVLNFGGRPLRLMYYTQEPFSEDEESKIQEFKDFCNQRKLIIPDEDPEILRLLYSKKFNQIKVMEAFKLRDRFRGGLPLKVDNLAFDLIQSGLVYIQGRDKHFRPIMVMNARKFIEHANNPDSLIAAMAITIEYIKYYMMEPGRIENVINIIDLTGVGFSQSITTLANKFKETIASNYKALGRAVYMLNCPTAFSIVWNTIKYLFDETSVRKITITSKSSCPELLELMQPNQIEQKYGGTANNRAQGEYWPPSLPDEDFSRELQNSEKSATSSAFPLNLQDAEDSDDLLEFSDCLQE